MYENDLSKFCWKTDMMGTPNSLQSWQLSMDLKLLLLLKTAQKDLVDGRLSPFFLVSIFSFKDIFQYILGSSHLDLFLVQNSGLPWLTPKSTLSLSSLTDAIAGAFGVCISISIYLLTPFFTYQCLN